MDTKYGGYMGKTLEVDLTTGETDEYHVSDRDRLRYIGGKIMAAKILFKELSPGIDPFDPVRSGQHHRFHDRAAHGQRRAVHEPVRRID